MICRFKPCVDRPSSHSGKLSNRIFTPRHGARLHQVKRPPCTRLGSHVRFKLQRASNERLESSLEVLHLAREQLYAETDHRRPDGAISLAKACLLIALEEEAAGQQDVFQNGKTSLTHLEALVDDVQPALAQNKQQPSDAGTREVGSAASWSLSRLVALAHEVKACFVQQHMYPAQPSPADPTSAEAKPMPGSILANTDSKDTSSEAASQRARKTMHSVAEAMHRYPMQTIAALNTVLFDRHGYHRMYQHGDPRDAQLNNVLDYGSGTPVALAVLYMEVARRAGYPMVGCPLEEQFLVWPEAHGLKVGGADFVLDPYSQGALYSTAEVAELFGLAQSSAAGLQPASKRQTIAALLAGLKDAHWSKAVGCFPQPALMQPISLHTAASGAVQPMLGHHIARALAAAERRSFLLPDAWHGQLEHVLLLYFASQHKKALEEMQQLRATFTASISAKEQEQLDIVTTRIMCAQQEAEGV